MNLTELNWIVNLFIIDDSNNNDQQQQLQQQQQLNELQRQQQAAELQRQHEEYLALYRQALGRLQKENPAAALLMPGINVAELEEREKEIVEDMGRIIYSKRYYDLTHQYRYI